jgi:quinol monooxygenase YgiN
LADGPPVSYWFACSRHANPARIPVSPSGRWYQLQLRERLPDRQFHRQQPASVQAADAPIVSGDHVTQKADLYQHARGGLLVVAQWKAAPGQAGPVAEILHRFLPQAQAEPGTRLFQIARAKEDPTQFVFYELFADEAAFAAHQATDHFKTLILGEALPLLAERQRTQYTLL